MWCCGGYCCCWTFWGWGWYGLFFWEFYYKRASYYCGVYKYKFESCGHYLKSLVCYIKKYRSSLSFIGRCVAVIFLLFICLLLGIFTICGSVIKGSIKKFRNSNRVVHFLHFSSRKIIQIFRLCLKPSYIIGNKVQILTSIASDKHNTIMIGILSKRTYVPGPTFSTCEH